MDLKQANPEQLEAITHGEGPLLIVAGAGTGKTRVITQRIAWLIMEEKAKVHEILALTFTEKAAQEMEERVDQLLPYGYVDLWISTFHSFCDKILKQHALDIGLSPQYKLLDETQSWLMIRQNLNRFNLDYYRPLGNPTKFIHALIKHFSRCKDEGITPEDYLQYAENIKLDTGQKDFVKQLDLESLDTGAKKEMIKSEILRLEEIANSFHVYQQLLLENDAMDFADLISYCIRLLKERPLILQKYRQQFKYLLVDEFQDTNFVQYELIKLLAEPKNNLTVVGDDDQSVYRFRGSSIANIMQFKSDYPQAKEVVLTQNYRSEQKILDRSYDFIKQNNPNRLEQQLKINKQLQSAVGQGGLVEHLHFDTAENQARGIINKILAIKDSAPSSTWSDFAILVRANDSAKQYINLLSQARIPHQYLALKGLYHKPVVIDIINYFKLLDNYHDNTAVFRCLNLPFLSVSPIEITKLTHFAKQKSLSLFEVLRQSSVVPGLSSDSRKKINKLISQVEKDQALAKQKKTSEVFLNFIYHSGYLDYLKRLPEPESKDQVGFLQQFFQKIQSFEAGCEETGLFSFMSMIEMELEAGESGRLSFDIEQGPEMVKVMTVHTAKGLEFEYVFIVDLVDRKFPTDQRKELIQIPDGLIKNQLINQTDFHLEEERRLFYVAMTRAKKQLFLVSAQDYGGLRPKKLSRFLVELGFSSLMADQTVQSRTPMNVNSQTVQTVEPAIYLPKFFSFSALSSFAKCPYQYYFAKVLKIPTFGKAAFTFGDVIHRTLKDFLEQSFSVSTTQQADLFSTISTIEPPSLLPIQSLLEIYESNWRDDWFLDKEQKDNYYTKGRELLKTFHADFLKSKPRVRMLEQPFALRLNQYKLVGRIDRVDDIEGGVEIIDYKTGVAKSDNLSTEDRRQLVLYQIAAEDVLGLKPVKLTFHYLEGNQKNSFEATDKDKLKLKEKLLQDIQLVQQGKFEPTPSQFVCQFCDYNNICEHRKS